MQASSIKVSGETRAEAEKPLNNKARRELREQRVKDLIKRKPYMARITGEELSEATQVPVNNAWAFVRNMAKRGDIVMHNLTPRTYAFTLSNPITVSTPAKVNQESEKPTGGGVTAPTHSNPTLAEYAKTFAWENNSDSLREFVAYMDGKELELRRLSDKL